MDCSSIATELHEDVVAAILAGGEGKRFRPLTYYIPKPMIPVGCSERPVIDVIVEWITRNGIRDLILLVGYKWRQLFNYIGDGSRYGARVKYVVDKQPYSNTGGALRRALDLGLLKGFRDVLIWYGDIIAPVNVHELLRQHRETSADLTIVVSKSYRVPVGVVEIDSGGRVVDMREKPPLDLGANMGVLVVKEESLERAIAESGLGYSFDISADLVPAMIRAGLNVRAYIHEGVWHDVGSIERYEKIDHDDIEKLMCLQRSPPPYVYL